MLDVLLLEHAPESLTKVETWMTPCQEQYSFRLRRAPLADWKAATAGGDPCLVFVEAPAEDRGIRLSDVWLLLDALQTQSGTRLARAFVVSTGVDFDSAEAQRAWMDYGIVVGYDLCDTLNASDVETTVAEMAAIAAERPPAKTPRPIGSRLRVPLGDGQTPEAIGVEYERHKLNHFLTNGMREAVLRLREASHAVRARFPIPDADNGRFADPFGGKSPAERFNEAVAALYGVGPDGRTVKGSGEPSAWLGSLRRGGLGRRFAPHILLLGETGTGKTLLARWIHQSRYGYARLSSDDQARVDALFQDLNCGGVPPNLLDSELFGGLAGAWSSLDRNTPGKIFCACGGTLFLDEIGDLPPSAQAVLLKFLDDGGYYPVGGHGPKLFVPVIVIAATNRPLSELAASGAFRRDLLERFRFRIALPSLKERRAHLNALADFVLQNPQINPVRHVDPETGQVTRAVNVISRDALRRLRAYDWPGNFRELEQTLWRAVFQASQEGSDLLLPRHLSFPPPL